MIKYFFLSTACLLHGLLTMAQQKPVTVLQVPGKQKFCTINEKGITVLPSGRLLTPAGEMIRISHDPFGMAISPNGKKVVTLHSGVFTVIDIASMHDIRVPSYNQKITSPLAHEPLENITNGDTLFSKQILPSPIPEGSFLGIAFASDSKTVYLSGGDNGAVIVYDIEQFKRIDSISLNGKVGNVDFEDSFTSDLLLNNNELLILDRGNFRLVRYSLTQKKITASIPAGRQPFGLAISTDKTMAFVANVGAYAYPLIKGATKSNYDSLMIPYHPYGDNTKEAREGTTIEGREIPGVGSPNAPEAMSVFAIDLRTNKVVDKFKTGH
jgi:DNA-binding beta-propeller fold protein YncE